MTEDEKKALELKEQKDKEAMFEEILGKVKDLIAKSHEDSDNVTKTELDKKCANLSKEINDSFDNEQMKKLNKNITSMLEKQEKMAKQQDVQGLALKDIKEGSNIQKEVMSFQMALKNAVMNHPKANEILKDRHDENGKRKSLLAYFSDEGNKETPVFKIPIQMKSAVDMFNTNIAGDYVDFLALSELDPNIVGIPLSIYEHVTTYMPSRNTSKPDLYLLVAYSYTDGSDKVDEGGTPGQSSVLFKTIKIPTYKISAFATLGDETLDDFPEALEELAAVMPSKILDAISEKVLSTSTATTDIIGLRTTTNSTAFDSANYVQSVKGANIIDVIAKNKLQCLDNKYKPDTVWLTPNNSDDLAALKDAIENSVLDRRVKFDGIGNPINVCGLNIKVTTDIEDNQLIVGDNKKNMLGIRKSMEFKIGLSGNNFRDGEITAKVTVRIAYGVRDKAAFIYCNNITTAIDDINKPQD